MNLDELRAVAATQHRLVLVRSLGGFGLTRRQVARLRGEGWLTDVRRGVVLVGGGRPSEWQEVVAAWLAAGSCSAVSHSTAARIHDFAGVAPRAADGSKRPIELSVPVGLQPRLADCVVHRVVRLSDEDVTVRRGVRVTTPARTLIDIAPRLPAPLLEKVVDEGLISRLWDERALEAAILSGNGRSGIDTLRRLMASRCGGSAVDTHLEQAVTRALACLGPFETGYEVVIDGRVYILDIAWPVYKVAVECDGWNTRSRSRSKFDHDRRKDNDLASHGWSVVHLTSAMSDDEMRSTVIRVMLRAAAAVAITS